MDQFESHASVNRAAILAHRRRYIWENSSVIGSEDSKHAVSCAVALVEATA